MCIRDSPPTATAASSFEPIWLDIRASVTWMPAMARLFAISGAANFSNEDIFLNFIDCMFSY